jgi:DNA polymerase-3 subunit beta
MNENISIKGVDIQVSLVLDKFKTALSGVERIVSSRSTLPILNNVLIKADKTGVEVVATDLEIGVKFFLGGKVDQEGSITVPGKTLINLVNNLHGDTINLTSKHNILEVVCGETKADINGVPADDYPEIPQVENGKQVKFKGVELDGILAAVDFAASRDESRPVLTGVYFVSKDGKLSVAATDSYRLAEIVLDSNLGEEFSVVIPNRTLQEVRRIIGGSEEVELRVGENQVMFGFANASLVSRIIEGEYPPYKQIIPASHTLSAEFDIQEMADALKTASIFSLEGSNSVKLNIQSSGEIEITSESSQLGNFVAKIPAVVSGEPSEITFNARYVLDGLNSFDTVKCVMESGGKTAPGLFRPVGGEGRLYIVMPLRS